MKPILEIKNISKKFNIYHETNRYLSLRDQITQFMRSPFKSNSTLEQFFALQDVNFDIMPGETVGIIGKNGAGKSTLLKILSKITPPTSGKIISRGRIASLLEVGTGFHPELSGKENIFLNGSILGMREIEIKKNFDAIVDFAGVERFLDTPLKHYSSGMQLRLAFAVAAFLENEILIIDEVLAVGDAEFQKKCMGKMEDVSKSGRTILFVSHNMAGVKSLCRSGVLLDHGKVVNVSSIENIIEQYTSSINSINSFQNGVLIYNGKIIKQIELFCDDVLSDYAYMGCKLKLKVSFKSTDMLFNYPVLGIVLRDIHNTSIIGVNNKHYTGNLINTPLNEGSFEVEIPYLYIMSGNYIVDLYFGNAFTDYEVAKECFILKVDSAKFNDAVEFPNEQINKFFFKDMTWKVNS
jgi:lipopolysaccharide transport system ATP-binding protein